MDAIRKKMKSLKDETDQLYSIINKFEEATKESNRVTFITEIFSAQINFLANISPVLLYCTSDSDLEVS